MDILDMRFRWPDDPNRISYEYLEELEKKYPGGFIAQVKWDGWRRPAYRMPGGWQYFSKRGTGDEAAKQPPDDLKAIFEGLDWPEGIAMDMEWIGPRAKEALEARYGVGSGYHGFRIFDLLYMNGQWLGGMPFVDRLKNLETIFALATKGKQIERVQVTPWQDKDLCAMFKRTCQDQLLEGIVLRRARSKLVGHPREATKNPQMFKVKYRDIKEPTLF